MNSRWNYKFLNWKHYVLEKKILKLQLIKIKPFFFGEKPNYYSVKEINYVGRGKNEIIVILKK